MITVHHLNNSRSQRVLWLLEELELPYEIRFYQRDPKTMLAPAALRKVHPLGKAPVITDGNVTLAESGAIIEYILERYGNGRLLPQAGTPEWLRFTYWLHYAEGSAMPPLVMKLIFQRLPRQAPFFVWPAAKLISGGAQRRFIDPQIRLHMDYWETELQTHEWFAGPDFTACDIQMSIPLEIATTRARAIATRPHVTFFVERIRARPAYCRALEKGGSYAYT